MDKYRLVEEKFINAQGFIADDKNIGSRPATEESSCILRVTQQAKPRSCITDAMSILVRLYQLIFVSDVQSINSSQ